MANEMTEDFSVLLASRIGQRGFVGVCNLKKIGRLFTGPKLYH